MLLTGTEIVCPSGKPGVRTIIIDLKEVVKVENRIQDVRIVNPGNAPELLASFTLAWKDLHQNLVLLMKEKGDAVRHSDQVRARIILDVVPEELKRRGLLSARSPAGSEDLRESVLAQNPEYQEALERVDYIAAVIELLKGKLTAFDMAFTSVKKILQDGQGQFLARVNTDLKGGEDYRGFGIPR